MDDKKKPVRNRNLYEQHLSLEHPRETASPTSPESIGVYYSENGDVKLRVHQPNAGSVAMQLFPFVDSIAFEAVGDGFFEHVIHWKPELGGPLILRMLVDGNPVLCRELPIAWQANGPVNQIDIPSVHGDLWSIRNNPHGATASELYFSEIMQDFKRCMVYTPPGYGKSREDYPVLYMLHGGGANELDWFYAGHAAHIFDNLIEEKKIKPFLAVTLTGMVRYPDSGKVVWDAALENMLVQDVIPYIDANYRTKADKWNRALCGLSMGAYMTNDIGFRHPELFGYMGTFTASMTHEHDFPNYERPYRSLLKEMKKDPQEFARRYRVYFRSTTRREDHFDYFERDDEMIAEAGIAPLPCNYRKIYSEDTSKWDSWRLGLYDYVQLIFR